MVYINGKFLLQNLTGVQRFATEVLKEFQKIYSDTIVILPKKSAIEFQKFFPGNYIEIGNAKNINYWEQLELPKFLKKNKNSLLINFSGLGPVFYKNKIITIHDVSFLRNKGWFSKQYYLYYKFFTPISANRSRLLLTVSSFSRKEIVELLGVDKNKVHIIPNSYLSNVKSNLAEKEKFILTVSSIEPRKNLETLLKAFQETSLDLKLKIVGASNKKIFNHSNLEENANHKRVEFLGYVTDEELLKLYNKALFFVFPSIYEGFGLPPLEAMANGCPTLVSNRTSLPEVCGDASLYFDPFDVSDLAQKISICTMSQN
ncbi:MAG: glycosyltransferase family 4 protein [bacterium]